MDDRQGIANKHSIVKNPTWCGREVQWCRARDLEIGDRLLAPTGVARVTELVSRCDNGINSTAVTLTPILGDDLTIKLKSSRWVMRLEQGGSRKEPVVRTVSAEGVTA